jgi:uncharacterized protein YecA (UPF0149 family)
MGKEQQDQEHDHGCHDPHCHADHGHGERFPVFNANRDIGRNDPCPCGSGKKFKKCCLKAA